MGPVKLSFRLFGYEVATLNLETDSVQPAQTFIKNEHTSLLNTGVKKLSGFWVDRMMAR